MADFERQRFFNEVAEACRRADFTIGRESAIHIVRHIEAKGEIASDPKAIRASGASKDVLRILDNYNGDKEQMITTVVSKIRSLCELVSSDLCSKGEIGHGWQIGRFKDGVWKLSPSPPSSGPASPTQIARRLQLWQDEDIVDLSTRIGADRPISHVGKFLMLWEGTSGPGFSAPAIDIEPTWKPTAVQSQRFPGGPLDPISKDVLAAAEKYAKRDEQNNKSKVWVKEWQSPGENRNAKLVLGGSDWFSTRALSQAYEKPVTFDGKYYPRGFRELHEVQQWRPDAHLHGSLCVHVVVATSDKRLLLSQRARELIWVPGSYSPTFQESLWPSKETTPEGAVRRGLARKLAITEEPRHLRLACFGREWGAFWNSVLVYVAHVQETSTEILDRWNSGLPAETNAFAALVSIPYSEDEDLRVIANMIRTNWFDPLMLKEASWRGPNSTAHGPLHRTTGQLRLIVALLALVENLEDRLDGIRRAVQTESNRRGRRSRLER